MKRLEFSEKEQAECVVDVGVGVTGVLPGDRVAYACPPVGAYAACRTMRADQLVVLPPSIDDEIAAALMLKGMSAEYLLTRLHGVRRGEVVLSESLAADPAVAPLLQGRTASRESAELKGFDRPVPFVRLTA